MGPGRLVAAAIAIGSILAHSSALSAQDDVASRVFEDASPAVFQVLTPRGHGSGFLADERGIVLTNSHVVTADRETHVKVDDTTKVRASVLVRDTEHDLAVLHVHPSVVEGITPLEMAEDSSLFVGMRVFALGHPIQRGVLFTAGVVSRVHQSTAITDVSTDQGSSGGPLLDEQGSVVGISTFYTRSGAGSGFSGAVTAPPIRSTLEAARGSLSSPPSAERLPTMPTHSFPLDALDDASLASEWPLDDYDITTDAPDPGYQVQVFTPPMLYHLERRSLSSRPEFLFSDLSRWHLELGRYPPVVIVRVAPRLRPSVMGIFANLLSGMAAGAGGYPIYPMSETGSREGFTEVTIQGPSGHVTPLRRTYHLVQMDGEMLDVAYLVVSPDLFTDASEVVINVRDTDGAIHPWVVPDRTLEQIQRDFEPYFRQ